MNSPRPLKTSGRFKGDSGSGEGWETGCWRHVLGRRCSMPKEGGQPWGTGAMGDPCQSRDTPERPQTWVTRGGAATALKDWGCEEPLPGQGHHSPRGTLACGCHSKAGTSPPKGTLACGWDCRAGTLRKWMAGKTVKRRRAEKYHYGTWPQPPEFPSPHQRSWGTLSLTCS